MAPGFRGNLCTGGGTVGNLSALHAARTSAARGRDRPARWRLAVSSEVHSSVRNAASILDVDVCEVSVGPDGRMTGLDLDRAIGDSTDVFAVVATAGTTNAGIIDDLVSVADYCGENDIWLHVDGAYGLAAMASPSIRHRFDGIERADSFVVDPHKWLFAPYDACALLYRHPADAVAAHSQVAPYLDQLDRGEWNPCDYAIQLSRRPRGLPFWFSLATYGTKRYGEAIDRVIATAREITKLIDGSDFGELVGYPDLSVILFRVPNRSDDEVRAWSDAQALAGTILCLPTTHRGELVLRICLVNPDTDAREVFSVLETLRG